MEAFLKFVFILVIIYYAIVLAVRYILPWLVGRFVKKQQEKFFGQGQSSTKSDEPRKKNNVDKQTGKPQHKDDKSFGEYVDFEDVKE